MDVYHGQEMSLESKHHGEGVNVLAIHQPQTLGSLSPRVLYLCSSDDVETPLERRPLCVQVSVVHS